MSYIALGIAFLSGFVFGGLYMIVAYKHKVAEISDMQNKAVAVADYAIKKLEELDRALEKTNG